MTNEDLLISLILNGLNTVNHAHILAHLEGSLCNFELDISQAVLTNNLKELLTKFI